MSLESLNMLTALPAVQVAPTPILFTAVQSTVVITLRPPPPPYTLLAGADEVVLMANPLPRIRTAAGAPTHTTDDLHASPVQTRRSVVHRFVQGVRVMKLRIRAVGQKLKAMRNHQ